MKFAALLARFPAISLATQENNDEILSYFNNTSMKTPFIDVQYDRGNNFFSFLEKASDQNIVLIGKDKAGTLGLVASMTIRKGRINNQDTIVGQLGDLRIAPNLEIILAWRKFFPEFLKNLSQIDELNGLQYLISAVMDDNKKAINSFVTKGRNKFIFKKLTSYRMINIVAKIPFYTPSDENQIGSAKQQDLPDLISFLNKQHEHKAFGFCYGTSDNELSRRLTCWDNFSVEQFIIARNKNGELIACVAPHNPTPHKSIQVKSVARKTRLLLKPLNLFKKMPQAGTELKITYLTHLEIAKQYNHSFRAKVFNDILLWAWQQGVFTDAHLVSFSDFEEALQDSLKGFIYMSEALSLYQVYHQDHESALQKTGDMPPGFEMAMV